MAFEGKAESEAGFLSILFILTKLKREKPFFFFAMSTETCIIQGA